MNLPNLHPEITALLSSVESLGRSLASSAEASNYSFERAHHAKSYKPMLVATRQAWKAIRLAKDPVTVLTDLRRVIPTGIERNHLEQLITEARIRVERANGSQVALPSWVR